MALIKSSENASDASDRDPTAGVFDAFLNARDAASSQVSGRDLTATN